MHSAEDALFATEAVAAGGIPIVRVTITVVFGILYLAMFLGWVGLGLFMLLALTRFINFVHDYAGGLAESRPRMATIVPVRVMGAGFIAFAIHFARRATELPR